MGLNYEEFTELFTRFDREAIHLEMRDSYGTAIELPHLAKWVAGEPDDLEWLRPWCDHRLVVFHHYAGNGVNIDFTTSTDPADIALCSSAFEAVWPLAIPHCYYRPGRLGTEPIAWSVPSFRWAFAGIGS